MRSEKRRDVKVFLDVPRKLGDKSSPLLSTSASCEGKSRVELFCKTASIRKNEMYLISKTHVLMCSTVRGLLKTITFDTCTLMEMCKRGIE